MKDFGQKMPPYLTIYEATTTRMHQLTRKLTEQYKEISATVNEIAECSLNYARIYRLTDDFQFSKLYQEIEKSFKSWSRVANNIANV